jgi:hypothetical protein
MRFKEVHLTVIEYDISKRAKREKQEETYLRTGLKIIKLSGLAIYFSEILNLFVRSYSLSGFGRYRGCGGETES